MKFLYGFLPSMIKTHLGCFSACTRSWNQWDKQIVRSRFNRRHRASLCRKEGGITL